MKPFCLHISLLGTAAVVTACGDLDDRAAPAFGLLVECLAHRMEAVILDVGHVTSTGGAVAGLLRRLRAYGAGADCEIAIIGRQPEPLGAPAAAGRPVPAGPAGAVDDANSLALRRAVRAHAVAGWARGVASAHSRRHPCG
ncbi:STAS domain-containing protein [Actinacidiphila sp. ITFR-21]|uniref:STAS domain-containing protein n=1 Tax=Actinacidiphila sp. ITFR-21 TaxID=3075199 RepID=UPI00288C15FF|nr:hypothetical protein [Streptomyces sp. ITFR-21]WNI14290.1 hypothetical protein RLT57_01245 [Streptomyces sp. ITFR-21]